jgi:FixJ family two-component response regulator
MAGKKTTIAVVDKDLAVRKAMTRLLPLLGYLVECYASAGEFLAAAPTSGDLCLLVDIAPGDMSGLEMVRKLSASGSKCPVIFMTGSGSDVVREKANALNCADYLFKPIPVAQLIESIDRATGRKSRIG